MLVFLCFGLQLFLPFLNGCSWALVALLSGGAPRHPGLGSQLWKASPSHGCENSLSHWSQTQPTAGIRPSADSPFHRRPGSTWTLLIFLVAFFVGFHSERTANL